jgi:hypothetical protein
VKSEGAGIGFLSHEIAGSVLRDGFTGLTARCENTIKMKV